LQTAQRSAAVANVEDVAFAYDDRSIVSDFSDIMRGDDRHRQSQQRRQNDAPPATLGQLAPRQFGAPGTNFKKSLILISFASNSTKK
jgi:hypothetical protein